MPAHRTPIVPPVDRAACRRALRGVRSRVFVLALAALPPLLVGCTNLWPARVAPTAAGGSTEPVAAVAAVAPVAPVAAADPAASVRILDLEWRDVARARTIPVRLHLPGPDREREPAADARLPLVVFSHGLGGSREGYGHLGRHWAAQGIASLHVQHAGSDRAIWTAGSPLGLAERLRSAVNAENAIARARDVSFAIDRLLGDPELGTRIDPGRIAVAGHSFGANTALLVAGAGATTDAVPSMLRDPRVRAAVLMSAPPFPARFDAREVLSGVAIPTLHLTTVGDVSVVPGLTTVASDRIALYEAMTATPRWLAVFEHGRHGVFTDRGSDPRNEAVRQATRELSTGFLRAALDASPGELARAFEANATLLARRESDGAPQSR